MPEPSSVTFTCPMCGAVSPSRDCGRCSDDPSLYWGDTWCDGCGVEMPLGARLCQECIADEGAAHQELTKAET